MTTGILVVNLGTPQAPTRKAVRKYLAEFLSDPRVVELPRLLWLPLLYGVILPFRSFKSAKAYQKIWVAHGSPLLVNSQKITAALEHHLNSPHHHILLAMRYGQPSIEQALDQFQAMQLKKLIILPLYPQYSSAATGSVLEKVMEILKTWRVLPELYFINQYADNAEYIEAIANSIANFWQQHPRGEKLLFSFHGLPQKSIKQGDPYYFSCQQTAQKIAEKLQLQDHEWLLVFQSRFGREAWLHPYCDQTLIELAQQNVKNVDVICPGFAADCLETLEEMAIRNQHIFVKAGGGNLRYIPALNDSEAQLQMLAKIISG